jgi:hypothetical protein
MHMPKWKTAGRLDDMGRGKMSLRVEFQPDGDIIVYIEEDGVIIQDDKGNRSAVEFCNIAGGGGQSPHTRRALVALYEAMKKDAQERPDMIPKYPAGLAEAMAKN